MSGFGSLRNALFENERRCSKKKIESIRRDILKDFTHEVRLLITCARSQREKKMNK